MHKTIELTLAAGERKLLTGDARLRLPYVQRSGRPELLVASGLIGGLVGAGAVAAAIGKELDDPGRRVGRAGHAAAASRARSRARSSRTPLVPQYIPDNQALFILGDDVDRRRRGDGRRASSGGR